MSIYAKTGVGLNINSLTPRVAVRQADNGVVIRVDYDAYKFDREGKKIWQVKMPDAFNLNDRPSEQILSGDGYTYFWEANDNPIKKFKAPVVQVDPKGNKSENKYEELPFKEMPFECFVLDGNLCILGSAVNKKNKSIDNFLHTIDKTSHAVSTKKINMPFESHEFQKAKEGDGNPYWNWLATVDKEAIFYKCYFEDIEDNKKKKKMIIQLLEMDGQGITKRNKELFFEPEFNDDDRKFYIPKIIFNPKLNSLMVIGYMEIDKNKVNGLYLLRYDYATGTLLDKKEFPFSKILSLKSNLPSGCIITLQKILFQ